MSTHAITTPLASVERHLVVSATRYGWGSPAQLARQCQRLRQELAAMATFIPYPLVHEQLLNGAPGSSSGAFWSGSLLEAEIISLHDADNQLSLADPIAAAQFATLLNWLFALVAEECHRYCAGLIGGGMLSFSGQRFSAFFDAAALGDDHPAYASSAALALQRQVDEFAAHSDLPFTLRLRIGVHSGQFLAARVGSQQQVRLLVTGRAARNAILARSLAAAGEVVVSSETLSGLRRSGVGLYTQDRHNGFHLLVGLPALPPPPRMDRWGWESGPGDLGELRRLTARISSLRPYLPHHLPEQAYQHTADVQPGLKPLVLLGIHVYPLVPLLEQVGEDAMLGARLLNAWFSRLQQAMQRYGGSVLSVEQGLSGEQLVVLFQGDNTSQTAQRAVAAAVASHTALLEASAEIAAMVAGDVALRQRSALVVDQLFTCLATSARRRDYLLTGPATSAAVGLAAAAEPETLWLNPIACQLLGASAYIQPLPPCQVAGLPEPISGAGALRFADVQFAASLGK